MIILTGTPDLGHPSSGKSEASIRNSQPPKRQEGQRNGSFRGKPLKSLTAPSRELRFVAGRAGTADPLRPWRLHRKGTGHYIGPNLGMLRGHGFNSSAPPPLNGLKNSTDSTDSFSALGRWPHEILNQWIRLHGRPRQTPHGQDLETPLKEFKNLAPKWSPVPFYGCYPKSV